MVMFIWFSSKKYVENKIFGKYTHKHLYLLNPKKHCLLYIGVSQHQL